jgi:integrase/recombinase XerD
MPIQKETSKIDQLRTEFQLFISNYESQQLKQVIEEIGFLPQQTVAVKEKETVTFIDAVDHFLTSSRFLGLSSSTKKTYVSEMNQFKKFIFNNIGTGVSIVQTSEPKLLAKYLNTYKDSNTLAKKSAFLRSFLSTVYKHFYKEGIDDLKLVLTMKWVKDELPRALSKVQLAEILSLAQLCNNDLRNYTIIWTLLGSGIRLNELRNLQIGDIEKETQTIYVFPKHSENKKMARKISEVSLLILLDYIHFKYDFLRQRLSDTEFKKLYIFSCNNGKAPIQARTIQYALKKIIGHAQSIKPDEKNRYGIHTFRHCFALYGLESGIDIFTLSKLLGHKSLSSTTVYLNLFDDQLKNAIEKHPFAQKEVFWSILSGFPGKKKVIIMFSLKMTNLLPKLS